MVWELIIRTGVRDMANDEVGGLAHNSQCVGVIYLPLGAQRDQSNSLYVVVR